MDGVAFGSFLAGTSTAAGARPAQGSARGVGRAAGGTGPPDPGKAEVKRAALRGKSGKGSKKKTKKGGERSSHLLPPRQPPEPLGESGLTAGGGGGALTEVRETAGRHQSQAKVVVRVDQ